MSGNTPELALKTAVDADDTADYLTIALAGSLTTVDSLFNNVTGHSHSGAHQGGPIGSIPAGSIPDGSITSAKIADGTITSADLAAGCVTYIGSTFLISGQPGVSTTSSSLSTIPFCDVGVTTESGTVIVIATLPWYLSAAATVTFGMTVDGGGDVAIFQETWTPDAGQRNQTTFIRSLGALGAGVHTIHMRWSVTGGATLTLNQSSVAIIAVEFKK